MLLGFSTVVWARVSAAAGAVRSLIADFEATNGPLEFRYGVVAHNTEQMMALCDDLDAAAGYFYPFGSIVLAGAAALWCLAFVVTFSGTGRERLVHAGLALAGLALVVQVVRYNPAISDMMIISE